MNIQVEFWELITFAFTLLGVTLGAFLGLIRVIVAQFNKNLDARFSAQEKARTTAQSSWQRNFDELVRALRELERRFTDHLMELPLKYQRREDAIRQEVAIITRLDGLATMMEQKHHQTDQKIEALRRG